MDVENQDIFFKIKKIITDVLNIEEEKILLDSKIVDDLGAESLDLVTLLMEFEDEFDKKIPDEDVEKLITVKDVVNYIKNILA
jgi:acyl carrier protein